MSDDTDTLRRLIADEIGECCEGDLERRLDRLESIAEVLPADPDPDLRALRTLGDATRHRIARILVAAEDELCVCEISPLVDVSDSAISHALSDLADAGLVDRRKSGTWRYYRSTDRARRLIETLDDTREVPA